MHFWILVVIHGRLSFCTVINLLGRLHGSSKNRSIPPLQTDDDLICDNFAKCELINDFFSEQSNLDDSNSTVPEPIAMIYRICMFRFFMDSIFPTYEFLDTCSNPWSAIFLYRYKSD
jgi:hypothetical protein